jgi:prepilin-type N-terminal cleavage/methylation domain-containing protein
MNKLMNGGYRHKSVQGFTLIEMIVVLAVLAILSTIAIPIISGFMERACIRVDNSNARLLYQSTSFYYTKTQQADDDVDQTDLSAYLADVWPVVMSRTFSGEFMCSVTGSGMIVVTTGTGTYDPTAGMLVSNRITETLASVTTSGTSGSTAPSTGSTTQTQSTGSSTTTRKTIPSASHTKKP